MQKSRTQIFVMAENREGDQTVFAFGIGEHFSKRDTEQFMAVVAPMVFILAQEFLEFVMGLSPVVEIDGTKQKFEEIFQAGQAGKSRKCRPKPPVNGQAVFDVAKQGFAVRFG